MCLVLVHVCSIKLVDSKPTSQSIDWMTTTIHQGVRKVLILEKTLCHSDAIYTIVKCTFFKYAK